MPRRPRLTLDDEGRVTRWIDPGEGEDLIGEDLGPVESAEAPAELRADLAVMRADWLDRPTAAALRAEARAAFYRGLS